MTLTALPGLPPGTNLINFDGYVNQIPANRTGSITFVPEGGAAAPRVHGAEVGRAAVDRVRLDQRTA